MGGSLKSSVLATSLVQPKKWGCVVKWADVGQKLLWFSAGTSRQKARPITFTLDAEDLGRKLQADAVAFYAGKERSV